MSVFNTHRMGQHDDYMTPKSAWEDIKEYIPQNKKIWEAFYGDGNSGNYLKDLGFDVIHEKENFFIHNKGDVVVSNPPFSLCKEILFRLKELEKPFILILPSSRINTQYVREFMKDNEHPLQIIIPKKRSQFTKLVDGKIPVGWKSQCNFDCFYYCWRMNLESDITWL